MNVVAMQTVKKIIASLPPTGGVTPKNRRENTVANALLRNGSAESLGAVELAISALADCAKRVGLGLTVNDLSRLVGMLSSRYQDCKSGEVSLLPPLYKGVSYNPAGKRWREWVVLLDFFALMREFASRFGRYGCLGPAPQMAVLDASLYWMVNLLGESGIVLTARTAGGAAEQLLSYLLEKVERCEPTCEIYGIALMRNSYMRAIAEEFPARNAPPVFSVLDVWRDAGFPSFLSHALENFCVYENGQWRVSRAVDYQRYMKYSPWVTPLVTAEQTYLAYRNGFRLFLAPVQEAAWNGAVDFMSRAVHTDLYAVLMYDRPHTVNLAYGQFPFFCDTAEELERKIGEQPCLLSVVAGYVSPFLGTEQSERLARAVVDKDIATAVSAIATFTGRIHRRARELAAGGLESLPLDNLGWLMQFPPGTC